MNYQLYPIKSIKNVTYLYLIVNHGFLHEKKENIEYSHILEHLFIYFTTKTNQNYKKIQEEFDAYGIKYLGITNDISTVYMFTFQKKYTQYLINILSNTLKNFQINDGIFFNELESVIIETKRNHENTYIIHNKQLYSTLYPNTALDYLYDYKYSINSTKNTNKKKLTDFFNKVYKPENICFLFIGDINTKIIQSNKNFKVGYPKLRNLCFTMNKPNTNIIKVNPKKDQPSIPIILYFKTDYEFISFKHKIGFVLELLLSNNLSSKLYREFRNKLGLIYSINLSVNTNVKDITLYTLLKSKTQINLFIKKFREFIDNFKISDYELKKTKAQIELRLLENQNCEYSNSLSDYYSKFILENVEIVPYEDFLKQCLNVSKKDLLEYVKFYLNPNNMVIIRNQ